MDARVGRHEALGRPAAHGCRLIGARGLDDGAAFVARRADDFFEKGVRDPVRVMVGVDDQEIDRADEPTCADRGSKGQDGPTHDDALCFGDEDAGLRQVDELAHEVRGIERAGITVDTKVRVAQCDETIDVGDTGYSDQVFHAEGSYLAGRRPLPLARGPPTLGRYLGASDPADFASMRLATRAWRSAGVRPTGIAFGSPVAMIRHRFGGHLRAARMRSCNAVRHAPPLASPTPWEGTVDGPRA
jgi:hypothetical protein